MTFGIRDGIGALIALIAAALALAGCGGASRTAATNKVGDSTGPAETQRSVGQTGAPSSPRTASSARLTARADAICTSFNKRIAAIAPKSNSSQEVKRVVPRHVVLERAALAELEKLVPPASLSKDWKSMLDYRRTLAAELHRLLNAAEHGDGSIVSSLTISKRIVHTELKKVADRAGFDACGTIG